MRLLHPEMLLAAGGRVDLGPWLPIVIILAVALPLVTILLLAAQKEKKRTAGFKQTAEQMGFEFSPTGNAGLLASLDGLPLTSRGRSKKQTNLMLGKSRSIEVGIFDYKYVTGGGRSSTVWKQSVISFQSEALALPDFSLAPKSVWSKIVTLFGQKSIEFDTHPIFSGNYLLRGNDVEAVRKLFTDTVLDFFEQNWGWNTEGSGSRLLVYKQSKRIPGAEIPQFLEVGLQILSALQAGR
ncbi:MAG TPA: hypothetical protein VMJ32_12945 [Pirellulales bacterium]|nr:hypothetical protein [Pirellulales bacterium]